MLTQVFFDSVPQTGDLITDAFSVGFCFGIIIGVVVILAIAMIVTIYWKKSLKMYLLHADENTRADVMEKIRSIRDIADAMAVKTNTSFFKDLANKFHSLVAFIKTRNLG